MPERSIELGAGATRVNPRPFVDEPKEGGSQLWFSKKLGKVFTLSGVGAVEKDAVAAGAAIRVDVFRRSRFVLAPEVEGGFAWGAANVGAALRIIDQTWVYTAPRLGNRGSTWGLDLPVGLSVRVYEGMSVRAEYRATWTGELSYFQKRDMFGLGLAYQF